MALVFIVRNPERCEHYIISVFLDMMGSQLKIRIVATRQQSNLKKSRLVQLHSRLRVHLRDVSRDSISLSHASIL